jgi:hypothetical protein
LDVVLQQNIVKIKSIQQHKRIKSTNEKQRNKTKELKCKMTKTKQLKHKQQNHKTRLEFILGWGYRLPFFWWLETQIKPTCAQYYL